MCHPILIGALVGVQLQHPVGPRARSLLSTAHDNHARVHQLSKGPQLRVDTGAVSLAILADILPLPLANWMDHCPVLPVSRRWS
jgi:hypothetical protein